MIKKQNVVDIVIWITMNKKECEKSDKMWKNQKSTRKRGFENYNRKWNGIESGE